MTKWHVLIVYFFVSLSYANYWYVGPDGNDDGSGTYSDPFRTISEALKHAENEDFIYLFTVMFESTLTMKGNYSGPLNSGLTVSNITLSIIALGEVTIDGDDHSSVFEVIAPKGGSQTDTWLTVQLLTINNATTAFTVTNSTLSIYGVTITNSVSGINAESSWLTLNNMNFANNSFGFADDVYSLMASNNSIVDMVDCYFTGNQSPMLCNNSEITMSSTEFFNNPNFFTPVITSYSCTLSMTGVLMLNNSCASDHVNGSGLYMAESNAFISGSTFAWNSGLAWGGAFYCGSESVLTIENVVFMQNEANVGGAGDCADTCDMSCTGCELADNVATSGDEGSCNFQ